MNITIERDTFADVVTTVARALPQRPVMPVLAGIKLTAAGGALTLAGYDYDTSSVFHVEATVAEPGEVLVSGRLLADIAKQLPARPVILTSDGVRAVIECGTSRYTLHTLPLEEYPALPVTPPESGTVDADEFAAAVAQVAPASSKDQDFLAGIKIEADQEHLTLVATDGYRVAVRRLPWKCTSDLHTTSAVIRATDLLATAKALSGQGTLTLHMPASSELLGLTTGSATITNRLLDGARFPKWSSIMPKPEATTTSVRAERTVLMEAINRVSLVLNGAKPLFLRCTADGIELSGGVSDEAQARDRTDAVLDGDAMFIAFNPGYLHTALSAVTTPEVSLRLSHPLRPGLILPADGGDDPDLRYVVMPLRTTETDR